MPVTALIVLLLVAAVPTAADAGSARMELTIVPGVVAEADYWPGAADMPAILIVHGFLQTRDFPTVRRLATALAEEGFSVLTPSLSLGLNRRLRSLACEAVHTHAMQHDVAELRAWTAWLAQRTGKPPVVIGHSTGGVQLAAMLEANPDLAVRHALLIGLTYFGQELGSESAEALRARARDDLARGQEHVNPYALTYCRKYVTTAANLLSYLQWDSRRLQQTITAGTVPVTVIVGAHDESIDQAWLQALRAGGVSVRAVAGARHFFDLAHEPDLLDAVEQVITGADHG